MIRTVQAEALAYAAQLDRTLAAGPDDETHDRLLEVGELCGGLSERGFAADLTQEIDEYEASQVRACGSWIAFQAREAAAGLWLEQARPIMEPVETQRRAA